jgi:hypothetical protein
MKKLILPALLGVVMLASCKKDYTCECTSTYVNNGVSISSTDKTVYKSTTKKSVDYSGACISYESYDKDGVVDYKEECTLNK